MLGHGKAWLGTAVRLERREPCGNRGVLAAAAARARTGLDEEIRPVSGSVHDESRGPFDGDACV